MRATKLGAEEVKVSGDGLPTPSVGRVKGTDVPVFARSAVSNPHDPLPVEVTSDASQLRHDRRGVARGTLTGGAPGAP